MFSDAEKAEIASLLSESFETFKEKIVIYKTPTVTYVNSPNSSFNFAYGFEQPASATEYVTNSGEFWATVEYIDQETQQKQDYIPSNSQISKRLGLVRISVSGESARDYLQDCDKIVFDGKDFTKISDIMPRGIFERNFYDCWLQKIDNG